MTLLDSLASPEYRSPRGPECGIALVLEDIDDKTRKTLQAALDNHHAPSTKISAALNELGHRISSHTIQRHRRNECRCAQK